ncbi:MAG: alpha/beta fold hydrolase [Steroidobacteraceae bacterium]
MSLWTDFLGAEIRYVDLPTYGRTRIAETGHGQREALLLMHGIGGHIEAYAPNVVALGGSFHTIAFDFVGHGLSAKRMDIEYGIDTYVEQLRELMDVLGIKKAHISGESLGGLVAGSFATKYPARVLRAVLNTTGGIPIVTDQGRQDLKDLADLTAKNVGKAPTFDSVRARMQWLIYEKNWGLLTDEVIQTRLWIYSQPDYQKSAPLVMQRLANVASGAGKPDMLDLSRIECETLLLWTRYNPIHDVAAAEAALPGLKRGSLYVLKQDAAHWPQYEAPDEFNAVMVRYLRTGQCA